MLGASEIVLVPAAAVVRIAEEGEDKVDQPASARQRLSISAGAQGDVRRPAVEDHVDGSRGEGTKLNQEGANLAHLVAPSGIGGPVGVILI